jgi:glycosyltransferase involved in cell wall biosynthesis
MKPIKILALYRGKIFDHRGTPIRVRSLMTYMNTNSVVDLTIATWDKEQGDFKKHINMTNDHLADVRMLVRYVRENKIDAVIGHTISSSYYLAPLKFLTKAKIVLEMHGVAEEEALEYGDINLFQYYIQKTWNSFFYFLCDLITTCSKSITDIVGKWNSNAVSMCGGVDLEFFNPHVQSGGYVSKNGRIVIGYAGNARKWQGVDFLVDAYRKHLSKDFQLAMLMSEKKDFGEGILVAGPVPNHEVPKFLIDCDILVIPRPLSAVTRISYPSKLTEYMAMGKSVVASHLGDMELVITNGENGMLYMPGNEVEFVQCMHTLKDKVLRERISQKAFETASHMTWDHLGKFLVERIQGIL